MTTTSPNTNTAPPVQPAGQPQKVGKFAAAGAWLRDSFDMRSRRSINPYPNTFISDAEARSSKRNRVVGLAGLAVVGALIAGLAVNQARDNDNDPGPESPVVATTSPTPSSSSTTGPNEPRPPQDSRPGGSKSTKSSQSTSKPRTSSEAVGFKTMRLAEGSSPAVVAADLYSDPGYQNAYASPSALANDILLFSGIKYSDANRIPAGKKLVIPETNDELIEIYKGKQIERVERKGATIYEDAVDYLQTHGDNTIGKGELGAYIKRIQKSNGLSNHDVHHMQVGQGYYMPSVTD